MFSFFKKNKITKVEGVKIINKIYPAKIILAWAKSLEGNIEIAQYLKENNYEELVFSNAAIYLKQEARDWLMKNGFPHLMAFIHASEGDQKASDWLLKNNFELLYQMALAIDGENESWLWLKKYSTPDFFILTQSIKKVKDSIEENHNDIHSFGKDS
ncbi:MAG: hypothetical protein HYU67_08800 [Flavobacteriia bacterium]|nr:hypothetical protein [Flavobacteriia bacterium]